MSAIDKNTLPADVQTDMQAVLDHLATGKPLDPATARRIRERGAKITDALRQKFGELDIGVPAIRDLRGELPE